MRIIRSCLVGITSLVVILLATLNQVRASGVFELRLKSFVNDYGKDSVGHCCSGEKPSATGVCSGACHPRFRVCLKHYQAKIDTTSPCTFGDKLTEVLGDNSFREGHRDAYKPIRFPFDFTWPGTFSLIVEALHDNNNSTTSTSGGGETLIARLTTQRWLDVGTAWTEDEHRSSHSLMVYDFRVTCDDHYYGAGCGNLCRPRDDKFGHYNCTPQGEIECLAGWQGDYCSDPRCLPGCDSVRGFCKQPNVCECHAGWKGRYCDECERHPGCLHGTCQDKWQCLCDEGWGGLFCNQDLNYCTNHKPCRSGGTCFNTGEGTYTCNCPPRFSGKDCETELDDCAKHPCKNGGTCKHNATSGYRCQCPKSFHGSHCETRTQTCDHQLCRNGATCQDLIHGYKCQCAAGFTGVDCENQVDHCAPNPCHNGGACSAKGNTFRCSCAKGFKGSRCEINIDDCHGNPCANGGSCVDLVNDYRCQCVPGYTGQFCRKKVDFCQTKPCANGGSCTDTVNDFRCSCMPGFAGKDCSVDIDECASGPCLHGGVCENHVNSFVCKCADGWHGVNCALTATAGGETDGVYWEAGNISRHVSERTHQEDSGLSTEHVVVIATLSTAVPVLVLVAAVVVMCMKQRRKREQQLADEEARLQNEQNAVNSSMGKRSGASDAHMIKNTWGKCVNTDEGNVIDSDACYPKPHQIMDTSGGGPVYTLQRARSHKQLNTDAAALHRQSVNRVSALLSVNTSNAKNEVKDVLDNSNLCSSNPRTTMDKRISVLSVDSSLFHKSDSSLLKRPSDLDCSSGPCLLSPGLGCGGPASSSSSGTNSSVYVIGLDEYHTPDGLLATEV